MESPGPPNETYNLAFTSESSRQFTYTQCINAADKHKEVNCTNVDKKSWWWNGKNLTVKFSYTTSDKMTPKLCKDICITYASFKYAALYHGLVFHGIFNFLKTSRIYYIY